MKRKEAVFSRDDTKAMKGVAVLYMLFHHLAGFPERDPVGFEGFKSHFPMYCDKTWIAIFASTGRLCVGIFFLLGGYGLYKRYKAGKLNVVQSVMGVLKKYWQVFFIFAPIAFIFFRRTGENISALATRYGAMSDPKNIFTNLIANFTTLSNTINLEWWFVSPYICVLIMGAVYCHLTRRLDNFAVELVIAFFIDILFRNIFPGLYAVPMLAGIDGNFFFNYFFRISNSCSAFFMGIVMAKYDAIVKLKKMVYKLPCRTLISLFALFVIMWARNYVVGETADMVYAVLFVVFASTAIDLSETVKKLWVKLGDHSTNIWLIHSFYCYYFLEATHIVYLTTNVVIDLAILLGMSLISSIIVELIYKGLGIAKNRAEVFFFGEEEPETAERR